MPCICAESCSCGPTCSCSGAECTCENCKSLAVCAKCGKECVCNADSKPNSDAANNSEIEVPSDKNQVSDVEKQPVPATEAQVEDIPSVCKCKVCRCTISSHCGAAVCKETSANDVASNSDKDKSPVNEEVCSNCSVASKAPEVVSSDKEGVSETTVTCTCESCQCPNMEECGSKLCCLQSNATTLLRLQSEEMLRISQKPIQCSTKSEDLDKAKSEELPKVSEKLPKVSVKTTAASEKDTVPEILVLDALKAGKDSIGVTELPIVEVVRVAIEETNGRLDKLLAAQCASKPTAGIKKPEPADAASTEWSQTISACKEMLSSGKVEAKDAASS